MEVSLPLKCSVFLNEYHNIATEVVAENRLMMN